MISDFIEKIPDHEGPIDDFIWKLKEHRLNVDSILKIHSNMDGLRNLYFIAMLQVFLKDFTRSYKSISESANNLQNNRVDLK